MSRKQEVDRRQRFLSQGALSIPNRVLTFLFTCATLFMPRVFSLFSQKNWAITVRQRNGIHLWINQRLWFLTRAQLCGVIRIFDDVIQSDARVHLLDFGRSLRTLLKQLTLGISDGLSPLHDGQSGYSLVLPIIFSAHLENYPAQVSSHSQLDVRDRCLPFLMKY